MKRLTFSFLNCGKKFHRKKFTHEEEELIDQFLLNVAHELDKAGFKVTFKPNRNTKASPLLIGIA